MKLGDFQQILDDLNWLEGFLYAVNEGRALPRLLNIREYVEDELVKHEFLESFNDKGLTP